MEMAQIRYVLAAARLLNFTQAAQACNVSQPALTKGIKALEDELGEAIFHREKRKVLISAFGQSMLPHLQHIVDEAAAAQALAQNFRLLEKVPLRLGILSTIGHVRLARFLGDFKKNHKGLELAVIERPLAELRHMLTTGEIDAAIMTSMGDLDDGFQVRELYTERYVVVFAPDHRLRTLNTVSLDELSGEAYVDRLACEMREMVMAVCAEKNVELYAHFRSEREDWVQAMVLAGIGFAFMPEYSVSLPGLMQRPLADPPVERSVCAVTVPGRRLSGPVDALVNATRNFAWPG